MTVLSLHHAQLTFPAGEHAAVRHFYGVLLGLKEWLPSNGRSLRFFAGAQRVDLVPVERHLPPPIQPHLAFEVQNLPGLRARLLDAGLALEESVPLAGHLRFYVQDPAGNSLEFLEPDPSQASTV